MTVDNLIAMLEQVKEDFPGGGSFTVTNESFFSFDDLSVDRDENEDLVVVID